MKARWPETVTFSASEDPDSSSGLCRGQQQEMTSKWECPAKGHSEQLMPSPSGKLPIRTTQSLLARRPNPSFCETDQPLSRQCQPDEKARCFPWDSISFPQLLPYNRSQSFHLRNWPDGKSESCNPQLLLRCTVHLNRTSVATSAKTNLYLLIFKGTELLQN